MSKGKSRPVACLILTLWLLAALFFPDALPSLAQGKAHHTPAVSRAATQVNSTFSYSFGQQVTFSLQATSDTEIDRVYLFYRSVSDEKTESVLLDVDPPSTEISVEHMHDLRLSPFPPFATVSFWWHIEYVGSHRPTITDPEEFTYADNRFEWNELSAEFITIHWVEGHGDPIFGRTALDIAVSSLKGINAELRTTLPPSINLYIYNSQENLYGTMALTGRRWVIGQAHPELGVIAVAIPSDSNEGYTGRMRRYIPHELTHLLVYQAATPAGYPYIPEWLDEGLATANEQLPTVEYGVALEQARQQEQLIPLQELCVPFAPNMQTALLSYAQSGSVVRFIREQYGAAGIRALLEAYRHGASCTTGVQDGLDVSLGGLETMWRASLEPQAPWRAVVKQIGTWISLWLLSLLVALPMIGRRHQER